jgi:N-acetylglucosaminyldiphosphoundecaprenol N-acetyl-beta-D-mannosaminyltransferase
MTKKAQNYVKMLNVKLSSSSIDSLLAEIELRLVHRLKTIIFTPNPEFLVYGYHHPDFSRILNQADFNLPDGVGMIIWNQIARWIHTLSKARAHHNAPLHRIPGSLLVEKLLTLADQHHWQVGIAGARRGEKIDQQEQIKRLRQCYPSARIINLDEKFATRNSKIDLILACHGMVKQEKWLLANKDKINGTVFLAIGGSLDYLTGFASKPPAWVQNYGLEWFWRLLTQPGHLPRVWRATVEFSWLMLKSI